MTRLSILDLAGGHQPMSTEDGAFWIVFNGEIYNAPALRVELEREGHRFRTGNSDTEVLLRLYADRGERLLSSLNGMFAFVIYDRPRRRLFGARDRLGIKPLYYRHQGGTFAFASEIKALLALPDVTRTIDAQSLFHYMSLQYIPGSRSIFEGLSRLLPAHAFSFDVENGQLLLERYWSPPFSSAEDPLPVPEAELPLWLRTRMEEAVQRWTLSDVVIGCSLSGGIDSAAVVGLLARAGHRVRTYTLGFADPDEALTELPLAREVAARWGTDHHEVVVDANDLLRDLLQMVWHLDEPYGGGLPSWHVFSLMSRDVKVALTGTGGDELFGNYGKFEPYELSPLIRAASRLRRLRLDHAPPAFWSLWRSVIRSRLFRSTPAFRRRMLVELDSLLAAPFGHGYHALQVYFSDRTKREQVFEPRAAATEDTASLIQRLSESAPATDVRDVVAWVDFNAQLPDEFLLMTDRFSMAHSIEARVPLLDHEFVEAVLRIPARLRTRRADRKYLLRSAVASVLPANVLAGPKRGFILPIERWVREPLRPLVKRFLDPKRLADQGIFRPSFHDRYVTPHLEGREDHGARVWTALMFQLWHFLFIEQSCVERPSFTWNDLS